MATTPYTPTTWAQAQYARQRRTWRRICTTLALLALLAAAYLAGVALGGAFAPAQPTTNVWQHSA